jgi:hypothetical protein
MTHHRRTRTLAALLGAPLLVLATVPPAAAAAPDRFVIDESGSFDGEACGEDAHFAFSERGVGTIQQRSGAYPYYRVDYRSVLEVTRLATGSTVRLVSDQITRDAKITETGEDTITILLAGTFHESDYAPDGSVGLRTQGRETALLTIDTNGTPESGDDDVELDFEFLGFVGHDDRATTDFCDWFLTVTA